MEGLDYLMGKMKAQDSRRRIGRGEGKHTKTGEMLRGFEIAAPGELLGAEEKRRVSRPEKL